jgi:hypothetical protein
MKRFSVLILICALGIVSGCKKQEYVPEKVTVKAKKTELDMSNPAELFPFTEGNTWTYNLEATRTTTQGSGSSSAELEYRVKSVSTTGKTKKVVLETFQDGNKLDEQEWQTDDTGIYQVSIGIGDKKRVFTPPQQIVKFPPTKDAEGSWTGTGPIPSGGIGPQKYRSKIGEMQEIDTDILNERLTGLFVENFGTFEGKTTDGKTVPGEIGTNSWFVPKVGLGRYKQVIAVPGGKSEITLRLKSYTVK